MFNWIMDPTQLGVVHLFCLEYLTLLMCFGIGDYYHMSVVKKSLR